MADPQTPPAAPRILRPEDARWDDLTDDDQARVKRLLTPDPDDNLDDLLARMERASQILRGEEPRV